MITNIDSSILLSVTRTVIPLRQLHIQRQQAGHQSYVNYENDKPHFLNVYELYTLHHGFGFTLSLLTYDIGVTSIVILYEYSRLMKPDIWKRHLSEEINRKWASAILEMLTPIGVAFNIVCISY